MSILNRTPAANAKDKSTFNLWTINKNLEYIKPCSMYRREGVHLENSMYTKLSRLKAATMHDNF
jgi:hypothetical protein